MKTTKEPIKKELFNKNIFAKELSRGIIKTKSIQKQKPKASAAIPSSLLIKFSKIKGGAGMLPTRNHQPLKDKTEVPFNSSTNPHQKHTTNNNLNITDSNATKPTNKTNILYLNNNVSNPFQSNHKGNETFESPVIINTNNNKTNNPNYNMNMNHQSFPLPSPTDARHKLIQSKPKADTFQVNKKLNDFLKKAQGKSQTQGQLLKQTKPTVKYSLFSFPEISKNKHNAQIPYEYFNDFLETFCSEEHCLEFKIKPDFIIVQKEINNRMRAIVVNWIIEVHNRFKLLPDTLFLSVILFDRYMSLMPSIEKKRLQLIGVTCLLLACKYEEIFSPEVRDFVCILDHAYEREDLMDQENEVMKHLKFEVTYPSSLKYYEILRLELGIEDCYYDNGCYLLEVTLLDSRFSKYSQALIAATVCYMLLKLNGEIPEAFYDFVHISFEDLKQCLVDMCYLLLNIEESQYNAVVKKYKSISSIIKHKCFN